MYNTLKSQNYEVPDENRLIGKVEGGKVQKSIVRFFQDPSNKYNDTLLFYFSGHGIPDGRGDHYLATSDTNPDIPDLGGFPFYEITNNMERNSSKRIIILLDCCFSGATELDKGDIDIRTRKGLENVAAKSGREAIVKVIEKPIKEQIDQGHEKSILASSLANQSSYMMEDKPFSMFTYFLLEGLRGVSVLVLLS